MKNILLSCAVAFFAMACWGQAQANPTQNEAVPQTVMVPRLVMRSNIAGSKMAMPDILPDFTAARKAGISGWVVVRPTIDQDGNVVSVEGVSGEPILMQAAIEAVRQWKYEWFPVKRDSPCATDASSLPCSAEHEWLTHVISSGLRVQDQSRPEVRFSTGGGLLFIPEHVLTFYRPNPEDLHR